MKVRSRSAPPGRRGPCRSSRTISVAHGPSSSRNRATPHWRSTWCTDSLVPIYDSADGVLVHLSMGTPEAALTQARAAVEAITQARPGRVVASTSGQVVDQSDAPPPSPRRAGWMRHRPGR